MVFRLFSKEIHKVDGRVVIFRDLSGKDYETRLKIKGIILDTCANEKVASYFPKIVFILRDRGLHKKTKSEKIKGQSKTDDTPAWVIISDKKNTFEVNLNLSSFEDESSQSTINEFVVHELTHAWHNSISGSILIAQNVQKWLKKKLVSLKLEKEDQDLKELSLLFRQFIDLIYYEGLAQYCQEYSVGFEFNDHKMWDLHNWADNRAYQLNDGWKNYYKFKEDELNQGFAKGGKIITIKSLIKNSIKYSYRIGFHMVYTILYVNNDLTINDIAKMKVFQFIRKYEESIISVDKQPVVTISSGKGLIDYNRVFGEWYELYRMSKKKTH